MGTMADVRPGPMSGTSELGELLAVSRAESGVDLDELSRVSGLAVERIEAVESGRHDLNDIELSELLDRYRIPSPGRRFSRMVVEIDLEAGSLRLARARRRRPVPPADRNLLRYLCLVHQRFDLDAGTDVPLRAVDLALLRASLALRRTEVESRLDRMTGQVGPSLARNRSLLVVVGLTGAAVAAGAIVLLPSLGRSEPEPDPTVDTSGTPDGATTIDPRIDIGTPLVVERELPPPAAGGEGDPSSAPADQTTGPAVTPQPEPSPEPELGAPTGLGQPFSDVSSHLVESSANRERRPAETS